jgi:hypothetical protein
MDTFANPVSYILRALLKASCTSSAVSDTGPIARPTVSLVIMYAMMRSSYADGEIAAIEARDACAMSGAVARFIDKRRQADGI